MRNSRSNNRSPKKGGTTNRFAEGSRGPRSFDNDDHNSAAKKEFKGGAANYKRVKRRNAEDIASTSGEMRLNRFLSHAGICNRREADDLIATYAKIIIKAGAKVTIISSDKDLMQLYKKGVRIFDPMKNKFISEEDIFTKFGVDASKVIDVQSLAGDSSDNVPGVPGIGVKTAAELINKYGTLEKLLKSADEIKIFIFMFTLIIY